MSIDIERHYDPAFDQTKRPKPGHECIWQQTANRLIEACVVPGCSEGRMSRNWITHMRDRFTRESVG